MLFSAGCVRSTAASSILYPLRRTITMPLRAKITNPAFSGQQRMTSSATIPQPQPGDEPHDVIFNSLYGLRTIELNRPKKLNTLNGSMIRKIVPRLLEWEKSDLANVIVLKGAGEKALCAGGDVAVLAQWNQEGKEGRQRSKDYFAEEYRLDHLISCLKKPYIAFMDGITMGGGVGLSLHAPFRIATERTVMAMPETTIGFFPEVGASFFLPRLDGRLGTYLALTSERLNGVEAYYQGVATHYLHSSSLPDLEQRLSELTFKDYDETSHRLSVLNSTISEFATSLPHDQPMKLGGALRELIDRIFSYSTVDDILEALEKEASTAADADIAKWADKTRKTILERSPTSVKVTLKQMQLGVKWRIDQTFLREHYIASKFMEGHDFVEGVSARLIRKPAETPKWHPAELSQVSTKEVESYFEMREPEMTLLREDKDSNYKSYPWVHLGLPKDRDVIKFIDGSDKTRDNVISHFIQEKDGMIGVVEKVDDILSRKAVVSEEGLLSRRQIE